MLLISASFPRPAGPSYSTPASLRTVAQRQHVQQAEPQLVSQAQSTPGWQDLCLQVHPCNGGFQHTDGSRSTAKSLHTKLVAGLQLSVQLAAPLPAQIAQNLVVTDPEHAAHSQTNRQQHEQTA